MPIKYLNDRLSERARIGEFKLPARVVHDFFQHLQPCTRILSTSKTEKDIRNELASMRSIALMRDCTSDARLAL
jgi:hypothetical protein